MFNCFGKQNYVERITACSASPILNSEPALTLLACCTAFPPSRPCFLFNKSFLLLNPCQFGTLPQFHQGPWYLSVAWSKRPLGPFVRWPTCWRSSCLVSCNSTHCGSRPSPGSPLTPPITPLWCPLPMTFCCFPSKRLCSQEVHSQLLLLIHTHSCWWVQMGPQPQLLPRAFSSFQPSSPPCTLGTHPQDISQCGAGHTMDAQYWLMKEGRKEGRNAHVWRIEAVLLQRGNPWAGITSIFQMQYLRAPLWRQPHPHYPLFSLCGTLGWRHISYPGLSDSKIEVVLYYIILPPQRKMGGERTILFHF